MEYALKRVFLDTDTAVKVDLRDVGGQDSSPGHAGGEALIICSYFKSTNIKYIFCEYQL